jgi:hypothetical protein
VSLYFTKFYAIIGIIIMSEHHTPQPEEARIHEGIYTSALNSAQSANVAVVAGAALGIGGQALSTIEHPAVKTLAVISQAAGAALGGLSLYLYANSLGSAGGLNENPNKLIIPGRDLDAADLEFGLAEAQRAYVPAAAAALLMSAGAWAVTSTQMEVISRAEVYGRYIFAAATALPAVMFAWRQKVGEKIWNSLVQLGTKEETTKLIADVSLNQAHHRRKQKNRINLSQSK